jgi:hypothetical protein
MCGDDRFCHLGGAPDGGGGPQPGADGAPCSNGGDCQSGRCSDVCLPACDESTPCAAGSVCVEAIGGMGCFPKSGGCEVTPAQPPPGPGWLLLLFAPLALVTARRARARGRAARSLPATE